MDDSILHASERDCSDEEDDEDKVGEQSRNLKIFLLFGKF